MIVTGKGSDLRVMVGSKGSVADLWSNPKCVVVVAEMVVDVDTTQVTPSMNVDAVGL